MVSRLPIYGALGWLLIAAVAALGHAAHFSLVLPMTSVVLLAHAVLSFPSASARQHMVLALILGYLDDLHHQALVGSSTLGHLLAYGGVRWTALRVSTESTVLRTWVCGALALVVNLTIASLVLATASRHGVAREVVLAAWPQVLWQCAATMLLAHPLWLLMDRVLHSLKMAPPPRVRDSQTEVVRV